jgi:hypothetical protein
VDRWATAKKRQRGTIVSLEDVWRLAKAWYTDPRRPGWRPRTPAESQEILASVGLTEPFWTLP